MLPPKEHLAFRVGVLYVFASRLVPGPKGSRQRTIDKQQALGLGAGEPVGDSTVPVVGSRGTRASMA